MSNQAQISERIDAAVSFIRSRGGLARTHDITAALGIYSQLTYTTLRRAESQGLIVRGARPCTWRLPDHVEARPPQRPTVDEATLAWLGRKGGAMTGLDIAARRNWGRAEGRDRLRALVTAGRLTHDPATDVYALTREEVAA